MNLQNIAGIDLETLFCEFWEDYNEGNWKKHLG